MTQIPDGWEMWDLRQDTDEEGDLGTWWFCVLGNVEGRIVCGTDDDQAAAILKAVDKAEQLDGSKAYKMVSRLHELQDEPALG